MKNDDMLLKCALHARVQGMEPSDEMLMNVKREFNRRKKENEKMNYTLKKAIAIAAMACLICASCFAAVEIANMGSSTEKEIFEYARLQAAAEEIGIQPKCLERFENGFAFWRGGITTNYSEDAAGNRVGEEYRSLSIGYQNDAGDAMMLHVRPMAAAAAIGQAESTGYSSDTYKFVPPDYEPTAQDRAMEAGGDFFISYGNDTVEIKNAEFYSWEDDGLYYSITAFDCHFGEAEMEGMAREIMG